jgi:hypothetical protein
MMKNKNVSGMVEKKLFGSNLKGRDSIFLYHYTSLSTLSKILPISGDDLFLMGSHTMYLNDPMDGFLFYDEFLNQMIGLVEDSDERRIIEKARELFSGGDDVNIDFREITSDANKKQYSDYSSEFYICITMLRNKYLRCINFGEFGSSYVFSFFCGKEAMQDVEKIQEEVDNMYQWLVYGEDGGGVCLQFSSKEIFESLSKNTQLENKFIVSKVIYIGEKDMEKEVRGMVDASLEEVKTFREKKVEFNKDLLIFLEEIRRNICVEIEKYSLLVKSDKYFHENEARVILFAFAGDQNEDLAIINYESVRYNCIVPRIKLKFGRNILVGLFSGPKGGGKSFLSLKHYLSRINPKEGANPSGDKHKISVGKSKIYYVGK